MLLKNLLPVVGYGNKKDRDDYYEVSKMTFDQCLVACSKKRKKDGDEWNGFNWWWRDGDCKCYKNGSGHLNDVYVLHYRFL